MAKMIIAPDEYMIFNIDERCLFLAGGITNVEDWQKVVIDVLMKKYKDIPLIIFNPRRDNFDISNPNAAKEQITWEFNALSVTDIFSMYFAKGESDQPICMYEYGKHLEKYSNSDYSIYEFIVTADKEYKRYQDVIIQTELVDKKIKVNNTLDQHINVICNSINYMFNL